MVVGVLCCNLFTANHDYSRFQFVLLPDQITVMAKEINVQTSKICVCLVAN